MDKRLAENSLHCAVRTSIVVIIKWYQSTILPSIQEHCRLAEVPQSQNMTASSW